MISSSRPGSVSVGFAAVVNADLPTLSEGKERVAKI
jgi:hypothetical protein